MFERTEVARDGGSPRALSQHCQFVKITWKCQMKDSHSPVNQPQEKANLTLSPNSGLRHQCACKFLVILIGHRFDFRGTKESVSKMPEGSPTTGYVLPHKQNGL